MKERVATLIRLSPELKKQAESMAEADYRSFNQWVVLLIKKAVEESNG